jgi:hypothetical protein
MNTTTAKVCPSCRVGIENDDWSWIAEFDLTPEEIETKESYCRAGAESLRDRLWRPFSRSIETVGYWTCYCCQDIQLGTLATEYELIV